MQLEIKKYLLDIDNSISSIEEFLSDCDSIEKYKENKLVRRAVERELEIIGEAVNRILKNDTTIVIKEARKIVNLRNLVIHSYDNVDDIIIWGIIHYQLPLLKEQVRNLLH